MNEFRKIWKQTAAQKALTSNDMALLCLYRAQFKDAVDFNDNPIEHAKSYLRKNFKPITNPRKIACGAYPNLAAYRAIRWVELSGLFKLLSEEEKSRVKVIANNIVGQFGQVKL
jgi:hypothetical protein